MTTATPSQRTRQRPSRTPDLTYLLSGSYKENPDLLLTAVSLGGFISCSECRRVVGVGASKELAIADGLREGTAVRAGDKFVCTEHAAGE